MIRQKGERFYASIMVDGREVALGGCATRDEAVELEQAGYRKAAEKPLAMTIGKWSETWLDRRETVEKVRHIEADRRAWDKHVATAPLAAIPLAMLEASHVDTWLRGVRRTKRPGGDKPIAPKTVREIALLLKQCIDAAIPKHLAANPVPGVMKQHRAALQREQDTRTAEKEPWTFLTADEQRAVFSHAEIPEPHRLIIAVAILTGMRQGEQFNLELRDVHAADDEPEPHLFVRWGGKGKPPKNGKPRTVWLSPDAAAVVRRWLEVLPSWAPKNPSKLLFPLKTGGRVAEGKTPLMTSTREKGKPVRRNRFDEYVRLAGIDRHVRWHDLRHSCATSLLSGTWGRRWTLDEVRAFMGWKSRASADRYAHFAEDALKQAVWGAGNSRPNHRESPVETTSITARKYRNSKVAPAAGLEPATRRLTAGSVSEWLRGFAAFFPTEFPVQNLTSDAADVLRAIARRDDGAAELSMTFARSIVVDPDVEPALAARAARTWMALEDRHVHAFDRVIDLAERVIASTETEVATAYAR